MMIYRVHAIDEFGRKFGNARAFGVGLEDLMYVDVARVIFERLTREILREMGHAAKAEWWGECEEIFLRQENEPN
jgi:hypothetical protein